MLCNQKYGQNNSETKKQKGKLKLQTHPGNRLKCPETILTNIRVCLYANEGIRADLEQVCVQIMHNSSRV